MSTGFDILSENIRCWNRQRTGSVSVTVVRDKDGDGAADDTQTLTCARESGRRQHGFYRVYIFQVILSAEKGV